MNGVVRETIRGLPVTPIGGGSRRVSRAGGESAQAVADSRKTPAIREPAASAILVK
ncbi:hypothetical protein GCM10009644_32530 [Microbacterium oxydans]